MMLIIILCLGCELIWSSIHKHTIQEKGQLTTCSVIDKYYLPANRMNPGGSHFVVVTFVWDTTQDTLAIQPNINTWQRIFTGDTYEVRYLTNKRHSSENCLVDFDKPLSNPTLIDNILTQ